MDSEEFLLLSLSLPDDAREILRLHYQTYLSDPFYTSSLESLQTEEEFVNSRLGSIITQSSKPGSLTGKLVLTKQPEKIAGYIVFRAPEPDLRTPAQWDKELREQIDRRSDGQKKKDQVYKLKTEDRALNERYLGKGYEGRWWSLDVLIVDESYQRRGLGSKLVKWGLEKVEESVRRWNAGLRDRRGEEEGEGEAEGKTRIEGVYLIASPAGARTYDKAGFLKVGEREIRLEGKGEEKYVHAWFVRRFE